MPTLLESLMFWRRQPTPQAPHQAEDKLIALKKLKESFDLDPFDMLYDRYWSNGEWWLPAGGGSIPGIGGTANKVQGHDAYVFRTEQELRLQRDRARYIFATEPLAQAIVGHLRAFTVGCGFVYQVKEKKKFTDTLNTDFLEAMQQCIDDWIDKEDWCAREQELFNCQVVDGEWFLRIVKQRGEITVRRVEPEHITNPPGGTVYNGWYLGVNCDPHDAETVLGYYFHAYPHNDGQPLDVDEVIHFKDNVTRNVSRGVSSFFCLADDLDSTGKLIDNCRDGAAARARIAYIRSHKNTTPSAVNSFAAAQASASGTTSGGKSWRGKSSRGTVEVDAGENMDISTMPSGDAEGYISAVGMMMRVLGNRWGMPEFMVSGDASNNNYASILVSGGPFVRQIEYTQAKLKRVYKKLMEQVLKNGAKAGTFPVEMLEQVEIDVQAPSPVIQDKLVEAQTYDIEARNKVISPQEWAAKLGRDPEKIQQDWDAWNDANMEAGMMMQGINPNDFNGKSEDKQKAQEQLSENTIDASGHAHLGKGTAQGGQFTGKPSVGRSKNSIEFTTPIAGPSGASIHAYNWQYKMEDMGVDKRGEEVTKRVSDWDLAQVNPTTGREIVHHFRISDPSGQHKIVSLESAIKELGYASGDAGAKGVKSLTSSLKTRSKLQMQLDRQEDVARRYEEAENEAHSRALKLEMPEIEHKQFGTQNTNHMEVKIGDVYQGYFASHDSTENYHKKLMAITDAKKAWYTKRRDELIPAEIRKEADEVFSIRAPLYSMKQHIADTQTRIRRMDKKIAAFT